MSNKPANPAWRVIVASMIGTTIEFYDFYAYATAAVLVFPTLFFPKTNPTVGLILSFSVYGAAMIARPVGAAVFGHLGDKLGRKKTLIWSLIVMGIATFLIGFLPDFNTVGILAPILLLILRLAQGFALGGEWSGAALVATENAPEGKRAWYGIFPQLGAPLGFIISNGLFFAINTIVAGGKGVTSQAFVTWGWRVPFIFSAVIVIIGLWVRSHLVESNAFQKAESEQKIVKSPFIAMFQTNWRELILGTFYMLATYVIFYLMTTFTLTLGTASPLGASATPPSAAPGLGFAYNDFILMMIFGVVFFAIFTAISGPLADALGRRKLLIGVTILIVLFGLTFNLFLKATHPEWTMAFLVLGFTLMGLSFGPMGALLPELFPTNIRYSGSAFSYNVSSILGAAVAPIIAVALWKAGNGSPFYVGIYLSVMATITLIALLLGKETKDINIEN
ncbi:MAG: MHS family MFS transporter [Lactobacillales bacterium]|jgi:metabolite-proton symporter|nr:MHS family MFS transporter [Lactobacillales bacterium]